MIKSKKQSLIVIGAFILVMLLGTVTYAFFNYTRTGTANTIRVGRISFVSKNESIVNLTNLFPIDPSNTSDMSDPDKVGTYSIDIKGDTDYSDGIEYLVSATDTNITTTEGQVVPITLDFTVTGLGDSNDNYWTARESKNANIYKKLVGDTLEGDEQVLVGYIAPNNPTGTALGVDGNITIKAYVDKNKLLISDTYDGTESNNMGTTNNQAIGKTVITTSEWNALQSSGVSFKVKVEANEGIWAKEILRGERMVKRAINAKINADTNACNPIRVDNMNTLDDDSDDMEYFNGLNSCVDMNYVWYSGKMWRIVSIYPDGAMKLVTQNLITTLSYNVGNNTNFYTDENNTSYIYQWLNEDFYDTLYNAENIIDNTKLWNASSTSNVQDRPGTSNMVSAPVGMINGYEFIFAGGYVNGGYLTSSTRWWLLNPQSYQYIYQVEYDRTIRTSTPDREYGIRPSIIIKPGLPFTGDGTIDSPFRIEIDKKTGASNELINTRLSGEYVKFGNGDNDSIFRIIGIEEGKTKVILRDIVSGARLFSTSNQNEDGYLYGSGTTISASGNTWYSYLNGQYYTDLTNQYGDLFDRGTYYLGSVNNPKYYKTTVCANVSENKSIKNCEKTDQVGSFYVGMPRYGEMFSVFNKNVRLWLITSRYNSYGAYYDVLMIFSEGDMSGFDPSANMLYTRSTLHLKSTVKILSGSGTEQDPYVVGL